MGRNLVLHVALNGRNGWSGLSSSLNEVGIDGPLKTITQARDRIRAIRASGMLEGSVEVACT